MPGSQPGPAGQVPGAGEPGQLADLGAQHTAQCRSHPGQGQQGPVAGICGQPAAQLASDQLALEVVASMSRSSASPVPGTADPAARRRAAALANARAAVPLAA
jgi:hypothetical protein